MSKYKICKYKNGVGEEWYQIRKRGWLFWHWVSIYELYGVIGKGGMIKTIKQFFTMEQATQWIKYDIESTKRRKTKLLGCEEV